MEVSSLDYCPYYCEENVWRLLARPEFAGAETWALAVFGAGTSVPVLHQRLGRPGDGLVYWDYHVLALARQAGEVLVLDFDSDLPFPSPAADYLGAAFPPAPRTVFRLMDGRAYCHSLVSDRSHMRRADGSWLAPPPAWPSPEASPGVRPWFLAAILDPNLAGIGSLLDLEGLLANLARG